jgi:UDP-2,3-diacylglucosamine hydrolase
VLYFEGNHDFHLKSFWQDEMKFEVCEGPCLVEYAGVKIWCEHGDEIDRDDRGYLFLRWLFRTPPMKLAAKIAPSSLIATVGDNASHASRTYTSRKQNRSRELFRKYAHDLQTRENFDLMVTGHTHLPDDFKFQSEKGTARLINLGSWFDGPHFLKISAKDKIEIITL